MKRTATVLSHCALIFLAMNLPSAAHAISITFDNASQTVAAPPSGVTSLIFSGTVEIDQFFIVNLPQLDQPSNGSNTLAATLDSGFVTFTQSVGATQIYTYTGTLFTVDVPAGTPAGTYDTAQLNLNEFTAGGNTDEAHAAFSVVVTGATNGGPGGPGNSVPENGATALLLGLSLAGLAVAERSSKLGARS